MSPQRLPYQEFDLGSCRRSDVWRVELTAGANVFMVDSSNLSAFKNNRRFTHHGGGGLMTRSPHDFVVPRPGRWYIVAHTWGLRNSARISVAPLQQLRPMDPARPQLATELADVARNAAIYAEEADLPSPPGGGISDVFISHASEDKEAVVRPLAHALQAAGLRVWYDEFELRVGASLRRSIDAGLANSRFGVVVLSDAFFQKGWTNYELDGLVTRQMADESYQMILPLWHRVTKDEVMNYSPSLADKVALRTADSTIDEIANEIATVVQAAS
jgi:TIR domain/Domain of unknown function (DUF1883)